MTTVRRIITGSSAVYRPRFTLVDRTPRRAISPWKTLLWCLAALSCIFALGSGTWFAMNFVTFGPLPDSITNPPIYPGAQRTVSASLADGGKEILFTSSDTYDQVLNFYRAALMKDGWDWFSTIDAPCPAQLIYIQHSTIGHVIRDYWGFYLYKQASEVRVFVTRGAIGSLDCTQYSTQ